MNLTNLQSTDKFTGRNIHYTTRAMLQFFNQSDCYTIYLECGSAKPMKACWEHKPIYMCSSAPHVDLQSMCQIEFDYFHVTSSLCSHLRKYPREIGQLIYMLQCSLCNLSCPIVTMPEGLHQGCTNILVS